jgi:hypothetical protein
VPTQPDNHKNFCEDKEGMLLHALIQYIYIYIYMHACWLVTGGESGILSQWMTTWRLRKTRIKAGAVVCVSKKTTPISKCKSSSELVSESTQESRQKLWLIRFQLMKPLCSKISQARLRKKFTTSRSRGESKISLLVSSPKYNYSRYILPIYQR